MSEKFFVLSALLLMVPAVLGVIMITVVAIPDITAKIAMQAQRRNLLSLLMGILLFAIFAALCRFVPVLAPFILVLFVSLLLIGLPATVENLGRSLSLRLRGEETSRFKAIVTGWLVYAFGAMAPFVGWFVILPYIPLSSIGAVVVSLAAKSEIKSPASAGPLSPASGE